MLRAVWIRSLRVDVGEAVRTSHKFQPCSARMLPLVQLPVTIWSEGIVS
jgi:hypothetical protein